LNCVGQAVFYTKSISFFGSFALAADALAAYLPYMNSEYFIGYWMFIMMLFLCGFIFAWLVYYWVKRINIFELTPDEYSCGVYILTCSFYVTGVLILYFIFGRAAEGNSSPIYLTTYTYFVVAFTISISFFQGRLFRLRIIRAQQV